MNMSIAAVPKTRIHPMIIVACAAVMLVSLTGTAALMGWLPTSAGAPNANAVGAIPGPVALAQPAAAYRPQQPVHHAAPVHAAARQYAEPVQRAPAVVCQNCGTVESIREVNTPLSSGSGIGAAGGAVVGGLLGNQVGSGHGRQAMTVVGAIGGALAGNQIEKRTRTSRSYETTIHMNNGSTRMIAQDAQPEWQDGDHVKIVDGAVRMNG